MARYVFGFLLVLGSTLAVSATRAHACSCDNPIRAAEAGWLPDLVFTGSVIEIGDSNVTAEWGRRPQPGLALLFEVKEVYLGEVGATVVVHTGPANDSCAIGPVTGPQLAAVDRDKEGYLHGSQCSIFPVGGWPDADLDATFGPPRSPNPDIEPEVLIAGVAQPPDPEDVAGWPDLAVGNGASDEDRSSASSLWFVVPIVIGVAGSTALVWRRLSS